MDAIRRLNRIKHKGQHVTHIMVVVVAGCLIALIIYISLLLVARLF